jgi:excisionase family DNA binding protein
MKTKPMAKAVVRQLEPLLTIDDVARVCKVSVKTVRRWIESAELRAAKLGAQWRIRPKDLELFIADRVR